MFRSKLDLYFSAFGKHQDGFSATNPWPCGIALIFTQQIAFWSSSAWSLCSVCFSMSFSSSSWGSGVCQLLASGLKGGCWWDCTWDFLLPGCFQLEAHRSPLWIANVVTSSWLPFWSEEGSCLSWLIAPQGSPWQIIWNLSDASAFELQEAWWCWIPWDLF